MTTMYTSGRFSISECDRCSFRYKLTELKKLVIKGKITAIKVCPECWEADQPQLHLGEFPVNDPQAVREPRRDNSYYQSGYDVSGFPSGGSRQIQWGFNPVGMKYDFNETPNALQSRGVTNSVTIS